MADLSPANRRRAGEIRLIVLDVDGVLTDGRIHVSSDGREDRCFDVKDGHGIRMALLAGLSFVLLSGRDSQVVAKRAEELGITEVNQGILDKARGFREILSRHRMSGEAVCFVGDDLIDVPAMRLSGFACAPADAAPEVREVAHHVTERRGGRGCVREVIDLVLKATGRWDRATARYLGESG